MLHIRVIYWNVFWIQDAQMSGGKNPDVDQAMTPL